MSWANDLAALARSVQLIARAVAASQRTEICRRWQNSSLRDLRTKVGDEVESRFSSVFMQRRDGLMSNRFRDMRAQTEDFVDSFKQQAEDAVADIRKGRLPKFPSMKSSPSSVEFEMPPGFNVDGRTDTPTASDLPKTGDVETDKFGREHDSPEGDSKVSGKTRISKKRIFDDDVQSKDEDPFTGTTGGKRSFHSAASLSFHDDASSPGILTKEGLNKLEEEKRRRERNQKLEEYDKDKRPPLPPSNKPRPLGEFSQKLNRASRERRVPGTRLERLVSFGGLAAGLGVGTVAELAKRTLGLTPETKDGAILSSNPVLSEANAERIVRTLCRVRGAALKLGQMLSIQDNTLISPELQNLLERVRQSADFMPVSQMESVMRGELGSDWTSKFATFDTRPFAAASIGQVHRATLHDGREVAVKIQYPGVAKSINSDIDNLMSLLKVWNIIPEGLYIDNTMAVARRELAWEVDYIREATCSQRFRDHIGEDPILYVPEVMWDLTSSQVLTTELVSGVFLDKLVTADQTTRSQICKALLKLCLYEIFVWRFMQTDPNWANYLYDQDTNRLSLLDFGASRDFEPSFTDLYIQIIKAASVGNSQAILDGSVKLGFLTGYESKAMEKAHVEAVMILGEAFRSDKPFDFSTQSTASRIHQLIPTMMKHRLTPPPEESYSLHRKMAGSFLLCAKLGAKVPCKKIFDEIYDRYEFEPSSPRII